MDQHPSVVGIDKKLIDCMKVINSSSYKIAILTDDQQKVVGVVTDGDIRRAILDGYGLESSNSIFKTDTFHKFFVDDLKPADNILNYMQSRKLQYCPILNRDYTLAKILELNAPEISSTVKSSVFIMAGGKGTRLLPLTANCPKPMIPIGNRPMLEILITKLRAQGFAKFFISVNYLKEQIIDYFGDGSSLNISIEYMIENKPLGTAGPLASIKNLENSPIVITNCDVLTDLDYTSIIEYHLHEKLDFTLCTRLELIKSPFGVVRLDDQLVQRIEEKPTFTHHVSAGIYVINPSLLEYVGEESYLDMPDLINKLIKLGHKVGAYPVSEYWIDIGRPETLSQATKDLSIMDL